MKKNIEIKITYKDDNNQEYPYSRTKRYRRASDIKLIQDFIENLILDEIKNMDNKKVAEERLYHSNRRINKKVKDLYNAIMNEIYGE